MRLTVLAVGKLDRGEEYGLAERYRKRAEQLGRTIGVRGVSVREVMAPAGRQQVSKEGELLLAECPSGALVVMDERGDGLKSKAFAELVQRWLDEGLPNVSFALGGADGHGERIKGSADRILSLGPLTLPHMLARVILLEQIYRAITICAGHPYHRS
ncbi:MAG: 23S rRNA (pseudouridine(1915)-N(3))-methyltransferase RlmH [Pseudomonadota bacterium]